MTSLAQIEQDVLLLPKEARLHLLELLRHSLGEDSEIENDTEQFWLEEVERRWQDYQAGRRQTIAATDAIDRVRTTLNRLNAA
jgi:hypothetical protein